MTGYQEVFTDPSYFGQILVMTSDHIGNYGVHDEEIESDGIKIAGLVCKKFSHNYSRKNGSDSLDSYFMENGLVGISEIDTRQLVRHLRDTGAKNAIISSDNFDVESLLAQLNSVPSMDGLELASKVSTDAFHTIGDETSPYRVDLLDYGNKLNISRCLVERGCYLGIFPWDTTAAEVKAWNPDGLMISNGPGDPASMDYAIAAVKELVDGGMPTFGICLGHQLLSLASGLETYKMHHGHRGLNHPVKNLITGLSEITSQNHGFAVKMDDLKSSEKAELTHINLNDQTVEGLRVKGRKAFSVQHHPEASPGPHDSRYLFDQFVDLMN
jgi:carbamoyl-phosphate synthase small subunit